jgi:hypothetical protein
MMLTDQEPSPGIGENRAMAILATIRRVVAGGTVSSRNRPRFIRL